jgi:hypothetical protein
MGTSRSDITCFWLALLGLLLGTSCSTPARLAWSHPDTADWPALQRRLVEERDARPRDPWAAVVRVTMREPHTGRVVDGRGAIAVAPGRAVRMILVGGAGLTLLDAWVVRQGWRFAVPATELVRRGGASEDPVDLPVGFLRWWFFTPLGGTLFAATQTDAGTEWLLRDGDAVIELLVSACESGRLLTATRRVSGHGQVVRECRAPTLRAGDWVEYEDQASGLGIRLVIESVADGPPDEGAFGDPDAVQRGT